jgi:uncharacterized protein YbcI
MTRLGQTMSQQVARSISILQEKRTGLAPKSVSVVLSDCTLVAMLYGTLSPAEMALADTPGGIAQVQQFHREIFADSVDLLRDEIKRITGVGVGEAAAEVVTAAGAIEHALASGAMVQVFRLTGSISVEAWNACREFQPSETEV